MKELMTFISRIVKVSEQLKLIGKTPDDDELLLCLLNGISAYPEYAILSTSLKTHKGMTFAEACPLVLDYELEKNMKSTASDSLNYVNKLPQRKSTETLVQESAIVGIANVKATNMRTVIDDSSAVLSVTL